MFTIAPYFESEWLQNQILQNLVRRNAHNLCKHNATLTQQWPEYGMHILAFGLSLLEPYMGVDAGVDIVFGVHAVGAKEKMT